MPSQGPRSPATVVNDAAFGTVAWINPSNARVYDGVVTRALRLAGAGVSDSQYL